MMFEEIDTSDYELEKGLRRFKDAKKNDFIYYT